MRTETSSSAPLFLLILRFSRSHNLQLLVRYRTKTASRLGVQYSTVIYGGARGAQIYQSTRELSAAPPPPHAFPVDGVPGAARAPQLAVRPRARLGVLGEQAPAERAHFFFVDGRQRGRRRGGPARRGPGSTPVRLTPQLAYMSFVLPYIYINWGLGAGRHMLVVWCVTTYVSNFLERSAHAAAAREGAPGSRAVS